MITKAELKKYLEIKEQIRLLEKELNPIKAKIVSDLKESKFKPLKGYVVELQERQRTSIDRMMIINAGLDVSKFEKVTTYNQLFLKAI